MHAGSSPARSIKSRIKMIQPRSLIRIVDNTGAKISRCIRVLSQSKRTKIGDLIVVSLQKVKPRVIHKGKKGERVKKGEIRLSLLLHIKRFFSRKDGTMFRIANNFGILVTPKGKSLGSRYKVAVPKEIRTQKWLKIASIAPSLI